MKKLNEYFEEILNEESNGEAEKPVEEEKGGNDVEDAKEPK